MKIYSFEKLECWQHARRLAVWVFASTQSFPTEEKFGLISQMRRAAISIASNIAEGTSRKTFKDQSHSSTIELLNDLIISTDLKFLKEKVYLEGRELIERQTLLIAGLRKSQQAKSKPLNP